MHYTQIIKNRVSFVTFQTSIDNQEYMSKIHIAHNPISKFHLRQSKYTNLYKSHRLKSHNRQRPPPPLLPPYNFAWAKSEGALGAQAP